MRNTNVNLMVTWVLIVAAMVSGIGLTFGHDVHPVWRVAGVASLLLGSTALGAWFMWCVRSSAKERAISELAREQALAELLRIATGATAKGRHSK